MKRKIHCSSTIIWLIKMNFPFFQHISYNTTKHIQITITVWTNPQTYLLWHQNLNPNDIPTYLSIPVTSQQNIYLCVFIKVSTKCTRLYISGLSYIVTGEVTIIDLLLRQSHLSTVQAWPFLGKMYTNDCIYYYSSTKTIFSIFQIQNFQSMT